MDSVSLSGTSVVGGLGNESEDESLGLNALHPGVSGIQFNYPPLAHRCGPTGALRKRLELTSARSSRPPIPGTGYRLKSMCISSVPETSTA